MKQKLAIWRVLLYRETKIVLRSPQILLFMMMPIFYTIIYMMIGQQMVIATQVCISMSVSICGVFVEALLIVAEKETNEWRTLNRAGITSLALLGCKTVVTVAISFLTMLICSIIVGYGILQFLQLLIVLLPVLGVFIAAGVIVGVIYNSMEEIVLTKWLPVSLLIILVFLPVFIPLQNNAGLLGWYQQYPTGILSAAMNIVTNKGSYIALMMLALKAGLWMIVISGISYLLICKKRRIY